MEFILSAPEVRILGCLLEKQLTTPDYYPLSLNALIAACNQKSNREPVVNYSEQVASDALKSLIQQGLVRKSDVGRVSKYEELLVKKQNFIRREIAVLCTLLLRGPQTAGELRSRTERMFDFNNIEAVLMTLNELEQAGFVCKLTKQPGRKEIRYAHWLSGTPQPETVLDEISAGGQPETLIDESNSRLSELEASVQALQEEVRTLKSEFIKFRRQFE